LKIVIFAYSVLIVDPSGGTPIAQQYQHIAVSRSTFSWLQFSRWQCGSFVKCCLPNLRNHTKFRKKFGPLQQFTVIQGHRSWSKVHMQLSFSH